MYHTNGRSIKNTIGVVVNRLVGMGLYKTKWESIKPCALSHPHFNSTLFIEISENIDCINRIIISLLHFFYE